MLSSFSTKTAVEKGQLFSSVPFLTCLEVDIVHPVTDEKLETLYLVRNNEDFEYNGNTYVAFPFDVDLAAAAGALPEVSVSIKDITGSIKQRMQAYGGAVGFTVRILLVNAALGDVPPRTNLLLHSEDLSKEVWTLTEADYVTVTPVAGVNSLNRIVPTSVSGTHALEQEFLELPDEEILIGCQARSYNMRYLRVQSTAGLSSPAIALFDLETGRLRSKSPAVSTATISRQTNGLYSIRMSFQPDDAEAAGVVKFMPSDNPFGGAFAGDNNAGVEIAEPFVRRLSDDDQYVRTDDAAVDSVRPTYDPEILETFLITGASAKDYDVTWNLGAEQPLTLTFPRRKQRRDTCSWKYKGPECAYTGELPTCDFSLTGNNGCAQHLNSRRFGGFPGIRKGN